MPYYQDFASASLTHPVGALVVPTADPLKFTASVVAPVQLVNGYVSCTSCHSAHFADSDSTTPDGLGMTLNAGDGRLLRTDGPLTTGANLQETADRRSAVCTACHPYKTHGNDTEPVACLVCHSAHVYNPSGLPNYFVLRNNATTTAFGAVTGLTYTATPPVTVATVWADGSGATATGYCEKCHGNLATMPGSTRAHTEGENCRSCHVHNKAGAIRSFEGSGCDGCHGSPPATTMAGGPSATGYAVDGSFNYSTSGVYKDETTTPHTSHSGPTSGYNFGCVYCHNDNFIATHDKGSFQDVLAPAGSFQPVVKPAGSGLNPVYTTTGNGSCSSVGCHSNGGRRVDDTTRNYITTSPVWGGAKGSIASCDACHGNDSTDMVGKNSASHIKHLNQGYSCNVCHKDTATSETALVVGAESVKHVNGIVNVAFAAGGSYTASTGTCSVTCHGSTTPDWDIAASGACGSCHQYSNASTSWVATGSGTPLSATHNKHVTAAGNGVQLTCDTCHTNNGSGTDHVNGTFSFVANYQNVVCNPCHGATNGVTTGNDRQPNWYDTSTVKCETCHTGSALATISRQAPGKTTFTTFGHGSVTAFNAANPVDPCKACHATTTTHYNGAADNNMLTGGAAASDTFCQSCHAVNSHYGNGGTGTSNDGTTCATCHEAHGEGMGTNTKVMLLGTIAGRTVNNFTDKAARASYWEADNTGVCQVCHDPTEVNNFNRSGNADATHYIGQLCTGCHKHTDNPSFLASANNCGDCHNTLMSTKPHSSHVNKFNATSIEADLSDCLACHDGVDQYTLTGSANLLHRNGSKNVAAGFSYNSTDKTCTNSCHSSTLADGSWNDTANWLNCTACHANPPVDGGGNGSAHVDHISAGATCASCHVSTPTNRTHIDVTAGASDAAMLQNMAQELANEATVGIAGTWDDVNNTCNNLYCHSNGQTTPSYALPDWDTTISSCTICHGGAGTTTVLTASHLAHIGTDPTDTRKQFGYTCDDCHVQTASNNSTINTPANHTNSLRDVAVAVANGGTGSIGGDFSGGKCATTLCHGTSTPLWTTGATNGNCSACHGMAASTSDGRDTNGDTLASDTQVGVHVAHLSSAKNWTSDIACAQCHKTTVTNINAAGTYVAKVNAVGHIDSTTPAELVFDTLANTNGAVTAYSGAPGGTCATSYCHDGSKIGHGWSGTINVPDWNTPFFNSVTSHDCAFCHGYPPNPANGHPNDADCSACHLNTVAADNGFTDVTKHLNGIVETEGGDNCLDCHGAGKYQDPASSAPNHNDHTNVATVLTGKNLTNNDFGNASYWYNISYDGSSNPVFGCGQCHPADVGLHRNSAVNTKLTSAGEAGIPAINAKRNNTAGATFNGTVCSGVYCHGDGVNDGTYANSPTWDGTAGAAGMVCSACHAASPTSNKHGVHLGNLAYLSGGCAECHTTANVSSHLSGAVDKAAKLTTLDTVNHNCTNTCHVAADTNEWTVGTLVCVDCHTTGKTGLYDLGVRDQAPNSGLHATANALAHDNSFQYGASPTYGCTSCHNAVPTVTSTMHQNGGALQTPADTAYSFTSSIDSYNRTVGCAAKCHDDNQATAGDAGRWMRKWLDVTDARPDPLNTATDGPGDEVCDNCHGDGVIAGTSTVDNVWNSGLSPAHGDVDGNNGIEMISQHAQCKSCHGWGDAGYNKTWGASHGNGTLSMNGPVGFGAGYDDGTVVNAASNFGCTAACHAGSLTNSGDANFNHKLADSGWTIAYGDFGSGDCNTCHSTEGRNHSGLTTESVNTHDMHTGSSLISSDCTQCHPHDGISIAPGTGIHFDGSLNFNNTKIPSSYDYAGADFSGNCSTNTCHDTDDAVEEWKNVSLGGDACDDCHNSGKTGIFSGLSANPPTSNKHGLHLANTALVATCSECHGHNGTLSSVSPFINHIDGTVAVGDQMTSYTNPSCANSCHNLVGNGSGAATWLTANVNPLGCNDCHNKAGNTISAPIHAGLSTTAGPATGKHSAHVGGSTTYMGVNSCTTCHKHQGELGATGIAAGHATGALSYDAAKTDYVSGTQTCTNVCHNVVDTRDWTAGTLNCDDCHAASGKSLYRSRTSGSHAAHYGNSPSLSDYGRTGNSSTTIYNYGCGECHPASEAADHLDGSTLEVLAGVNYSGGGTGTCGTNACHQNGKSLAPLATPTWGTPFTGDKCAKCHGNSPTSNAHGAHAVGIHYNDIYSGTTGLLTTATATKSHGNAATSTTINCSTCHNSVVTSSANANNSICVSCHSDSATPVTGNAAATIANKQLHVNGSTQVVFSMATFKSKAQLRDNITSVASVTSSWSRSGAYKTAAGYDQAKVTPGPSFVSNSCSTVDCHNGRPATWTDTNVSCNYCHTSTPQ